MGGLGGGGVPGTGGVLPGAGRRVKDRQAVCWGKIANVMVDYSCRVNKKKEIYKEISHFMKRNLYAYTKKAVHYPKGDHQTPSSVS